MKQTICIPQYESDLQKTIEVNNDLKLNVDEQQDDIKHKKYIYLKEKDLYVTCNPSIATTTKND